MIGIPEVLLARMASGFDSWSSWRNTLAFTSAFSGTASITRSASATAAGEVGLHAHHPRCRSRRASYALENGEGGCDFARRFVAGCLARVVTRDVHTASGQRGRHAWPHRAGPDDRNVLHRRAASTRSSLRL